MVEATIRLPVAGSPRTGRRVQTKAAALVVPGRETDQDRATRQQILDVITAEIPEPRPEMNPNAPRVITEYIPGDDQGSAAPRHRGPPHPVEMILLQADVMELAANPTPQSGRRLPALRAEDRE